MKNKRLRVSGYILISIHERKMYLLHPLISQRKNLDVTACSLLHTIKTVISSLPGLVHSMYAFMHYHINFRSTACDAVLRD